MLHEGGHTKLNFISSFNALQTDLKHSSGLHLYLFTLFRTSCPPPAGPATAVQIAPGNLVRKNLALSHKCPNWERSPLRHSETMPSAGDRPIYLATFSLRSESFVQHRG
jgi:hypothetical protein